MCAVNTTNKTPSVGVNTSANNNLLLPESIAAAAASQTNEWMLNEVQLPPPSLRAYLKEFVDNYNKHAKLLKENEKQISQLQEKILSQEGKRERSIILRAWHWLTGSKTLEIDSQALADNVDQLNNLLTRREITIKALESQEKGSFQDFADKNEIAKLAAQQLARKESYRIRDEAFICSLLKLEKGGENSLSQETVALVRNIVLSNERQRSFIHVQLSHAIHALSLGDNKSQVAVLNYAQNITSSKNYRNFVEYIQTENEFRDDSAYSIIKYDSLTFVLAVAGAVAITAFTGGLGASLAMPLVSFLIRGAVTRAVISFVANYFATSVLMGIGTVGGQQAGKEINNLLLNQLEKLKFIDHDQRLFKAGALVRKVEEIGVGTVLLIHKEEVKKNVITNFGTQILGLGLGKILGTIISPVKNIVSRAIFGKSISSSVAIVAKDSLKREIGKEVVEESTENIVADLADLTTRDNQLTYLKEGLGRLGLGEYADAGGTILSTFKIALSGKGVKGRNNIQKNSNADLDFLNEIARGEKGIPLAAYQPAEQGETLAAKLERIYHEPGKVKFVTQFELQQKLRKSSSKINNPLVEGLYEKGENDSYTIYIDKSLSKEERWITFNHEIRHYFGELSTRQRSQSEQDLAETLRNVEIRAQYQEEITRLKSQGEYD